MNIIECKDNFVDIGIVNNCNFCITYKNEIEQLKQQMKKLKDINNEEMKKLKENIKDLEEKIKVLEEKKVKTLETKLDFYKNETISFQSQLNKEKINRKNNKYKQFISDVFNEINYNVKLLLDETKEHKGISLNDIMFIYTFPKRRKMSEQEKLKQEKVNNVKDILPKLYNDKFKDKWNWKLIVKLYEIKKDRNNVSHFIKEFDDDDKRNGKLLYIYDRFIKDKPLETELKEFRSEVNDLIRNTITNSDIEVNKKEYDLWFDD